jgi:hypothetical protein
MRTAFDTLCRIKDLHQPERAVVTDCDYKDRDLVCSTDGEDWPCRTRQAIRDFEGQA